MVAVGARPTNPLHRLSGKAHRPYAHELRLHRRARATRRHRLDRCWRSAGTGKRLMIYKVPLIIVSLLALSGSPANTEVVNEKDQQTARSAWAKAVSLAKERNAGQTCDAEAYQSTILSQLEVAVKLCGGVHAVQWSLLSDRLGAAGSIASWSCTSRAERRTRPRTRPIWLGRTKLGKLNHNC
jgi:hypothetical protein